jgi:uncharacterized protein
MRLHFDRDTAALRITSYGNGYVEVNEQRFIASVIVRPDRVEPGWRPIGPCDLLAEDIDALLREDPEIVLLGTGRRQRFPAGRVLAAAYDKRVGVEVMDTKAACRTFNVLAAEDRRVVAGLIVEPPER